MDQEPLSAAPTPSPEIRVAGVIQSRPSRRESNRGGRPCKFTPERLCRLFQAVAEGRNRFEAAVEVGIGKSTLLRWLAAGRAGDPKFAPLVKALETAEQLPRERRHREWDKQRYEKNLDRAHRVGRVLRSGGNTTEHWDAIFGRKSTRRVLRGRL